MCLSNLAHSIDPTRSIKLCMEASVLPKLFSRLQCKCLSRIATSLPSSSRTLFSLILCLGAHSWMSCLSLFRATCITPQFATSSMHLCLSLTRRSVYACSFAFAKLAQMICWMQPLGRILSVFGKDIDGL